MRVVLHSLPLTKRVTVRVLVYLLLPHHPHPVLLPEGEGTLAFFPVVTRAPLYNPIILYILDRAHGLHFLAPAMPALG